MKSFKQFASSLVVSIAIVAVSSTGSLAQSVQDFVIKDFSAAYNLNNEDPQGALQITESITVDFSAQNRGILRSIPHTYKDNDLRLQINKIVRDGADEPYITYDENDNTVIKIGDADTYITGKHMYEISYSLQNVVTFYDEYDEFYWDINGDQWLQSFDTVSVHLDTEASSYKGAEAGCFTGLFGSAERAGCDLLVKTNGLRATTTTGLSANETLTIVQTYEKGYFTPPTWLETYGKYLPVAPIVFVQLYAVHWAYRRWNKYGKDYKARAIAPFFGRPKNVSVMQASYLKDNKLTPQHISAAIIDLSIRGYIKISEQKDGHKTTHMLELIKKADVALYEDEHLLIESLFAPYSVGNKVKLEDKKNQLYETSQKIANHLDDYLRKNKFYEITPKKAFAKVTGPFVLSIVAGIVGIMLGEFTSGVTIATAVLGFVLVIFIGSIMTKRSYSGVELVEHMDGLKLYLEKAEKDRIKMQDAVAAPLAAHTGEPTRDVKFFEKLLPFAVAAGVEKSWAHAFKDIYTQPPEWYGGNWTTFNTAALASSLSVTTRVTSQSFTAPSNSGSSGSGGGGFSGGGGGGGGGGGW
jgi:uncharacterized membrane protein YgcG